MSIFSCGDDGHDDYYAAQEYYKMKPKYKKLLEFVKSKTQPDTLVSISEAILNERLAEEAEKLLKEIGEF